jgi:MFS family permease
VGSNPVIPWLLLATFAVGWASDPVSTLAPAYADMFGLNGAFVGAQLTAFGIGAAAGIIGVGVVYGRLGRNQAPVAGAVILAIGTVAYATAPEPGVGLVALAIAGFGSLVAMATLNSNLQGRLAEVMRGRVMAFWLMAYLGAKPFAGLIDGAIADVFGPRIGILVAVLPVVVVAFGLRTIERHDRTAALT